jgi:hypothetical protein
MRLKPERECATVFGLLLVFLLRPQLRQVLERCGVDIDEVLARKPGISMPG